MSNRFEVSYQLTPVQARDAYVDYLWRSRWASFLALPFLLAVLLAGLGTERWHLLCVFGIGFWIVCAVPFARIYLGRKQVGAALARKPVRLIFEEEGFRAESDEVVTRARWTAIRRIRVLPAALALERSRSSLPIFVPLSALSAEARAFLERRVREAGSAVGGGGRPLDEEEAPLPVRFEIAYEFTGGLGRRAGLRLLWRRYAGFLLMMPVLGAGLVAGLGSRGMEELCTFGLGLWVGVAAFLASAFWTGWRENRAAGPVPVRLVLDDEQLRLLAPEFESRLKWPAVARVWSLPECLVVDRRRLRYQIVIPLAALSPEAREFLERKVTGAGGELL